MKQRTLLFWTPRVDELLDNKLLAADRLIEVPENVDTNMVDNVAQRLTSVLHEELNRAQSDNCELRIVQLGPSVFQGILEHVLDKLLIPIGGGLNVIKIKPRDNSINVVLDLDTANKVFSKFRDTDFEGPPSPDKRLFDDDMPATKQPPV